MTDIVIVGGGMCGLAAAFTLRCLGFTRIRQFDHRQQGFEGPWLSYAKMNTLRSPKHLTGPALGFANLTFRAWFEAQWDSAAWDKLERIDRTMWNDYLQWYRRVTWSSVENGVRVTHLRPTQHGVEVCLDNGEDTGDDHQEMLNARQVVLASGREGQSRARVPEALKPFLGNQVQHASEPIDFAEVQNQRVAVVGLAASAFDYAATALESGAAEVTLIGRAASLPRLNKMKQTVFPGFTLGYPALPDEDKLRIMRHVAESRIAPPRASVQRLAGDPRMKMLLGSGITGVKYSGRRIQLEVGSSTIDVDRIILATGFAIDLDSPPETAQFASSILRWRDRVNGETEDEWLNAPYLGDGFEFRARVDGAVPGLNRIRCFTHTAQLSLGNLANDIPAVSEGALRLANAITSAIFNEDREHHWRQLVNYNEPELLGDEWPD